MRTYRKWHAIIDAVGLLGLASLAAYWRIGHPVAEADPELANIWSNISTELLGAWAAARIVEYAIRRNEDSSRVRIRAARNLRYYLNLTTRCIEYSYIPDIELFHRELRWSRRFFQQHLACFSRDEIEEATAAYAALERLGKHIGALADARHTDKGNTERIAQLRTQARGALTEYEELAFKAESNLFEETPEIP
jgi:hypothetical protein